MASYPVHAHSEASPRSLGESSFSPCCSVLAIRGGRTEANVAASATGTLSRRDRSCRGGNIHWFPRFATTVSIWSTDNSPINAACDRSMLYLQHALTTSFLMSSRIVRSIARLARCSGEKRTSLMTGRVEVEQAALRCQVIATLLLL